MIPAFIAHQANQKRKYGDDDNRQSLHDGAASDVPNDIDDDDFIEDDDILEQEVPVLETKGGSPPPPPSPMEEARAQMMLERLRARLDREAEERRRALEEEEYLERVEKARPLQAQAYDYALGYDDEQIKGRGIDQALANKYGLSDLYTSEVDRTRMGIEEDNLNPMSMYSLASMFSDALDTARGAYRGDLRGSLNERAYEGYEYDTFQDTADDAILEAILGTRRSDALAQIDQAKARGQLNDVGYSRALQKLAEQAEGASADLQDLGLGVLSGYRDDLRSLRSGELDRIDLANFVDTYNLDVFNTRLDNRINDLNNRLRGDLYRAAEGQTFFDPSKIISSSGSLQGYYNPSQKPTQVAQGDSGNPLLNVFNTQEKDKNKRSPNTFNIGSNGVF